MQQIDAHLVHKARFCTIFASFFARFHTLFALVGDAGAGKGRGIRSGAFAGNGHRDTRTRANDELDRFGK